MTRELVDINSPRGKQILRNRERYAKNKAKMRKQAREYYQLHKEEITAKRRSPEFRAAENKKRALKRKHDQEYRETVNEYSRKRRENLSKKDLSSYNRTYYEANKERIKAYGKKYYEKRRTYILARNAEYKQRVTQLYNGTVKRLESAWGNIVNQVSPV